MTKITKEKNGLRKNYEMVKRYYEQKQTLGELTASKCKAKTAFTKTRHELVRLLKLSPSQKEVQSLQLRLHECQRNVLGVLAKLATEYKHSEYKQCWKNTVKETESIKEEHEEAFNLAEKYLGRPHHGTSRRSISDIPTSGAESMTEVTEDECVEVRLNDGRVQGLDSFDFGRLDSEDFGRSDRRQNGGDSYSYESIDRIRSGRDGRPQSSDDSITEFLEEKRLLKDGRRHAFHPPSFTQSMREKRTTDRQRETYSYEESEEDTRVKNRRRRVVDSSSYAQSSRENSSRDRTLSWDSSSFGIHDAEKSGKDRRQRTNSGFEKLKQDAAWMKDRRRLNGERSAFKKVEHQDWKIPDREDSPFVYKGIDAYEDKSSSYISKEIKKDFDDERNSLFQPTSPRKSTLRKHVSFGGFDYKKEQLRDSLKAKHNITLSQEYLQENLISVVENTKSFLKYKKVRAKLMEALEDPMTRRNKIKELQEMMRSYYNRLQDDIYILSEEYKRDIKRHEMEMMSAFNMAQTYLDIRTSEGDMRSESSLSIGELSLKDLPDKRKKVKVQRKSLTTDDLLVKFNPRF